MAIADDRRTEKLLIPILLFMLVLAGYTLFHNVTTRADSRWTIHLALSMLHEGNTDLDEFVNVLDENDYRVKEYGGHLYSAYPIGTSVAILPAIALLDSAASRFGDESLYERFTRPAHDVFADPMELVLGSIITALTAVVIYWIGRSALSCTGAILLSLIFAFATPAWSTGSRALWQHDLSMLLLASTLLIFLRPGVQTQRVQFAGLLLAAAYVVRPTNSIPIICFSLYIALAYRRYFMLYLLWATLIAIPFLLYNYTTFGAILQPYYLPSAGNAAWNSLASGLMGTVFSPNRGLFFFSPILLFGFFGLFQKVRRREITGLDITLFSIIFLHWLMLGSWVIWWGGHAYGPRLFTDMMPYLIYFMIPAIAAIRFPQRPIEAIYLGLFIATLAVSIGIHYRGVSDRQTWEWNFEVPYMISAVNEARSWDWSDLQVLRGLRPGDLRVSPMTVGTAGEIDANAVHTIQFWIENWGNRPISWEVVTPNGVNLAVEENPTDFHHYRAPDPLAPLSRKEIRAKIDLTNWLTGTHSLGGILVRPLPSAGSSTARSLTKSDALVIPVSIAIAESAPSDTLRIYLPIIVHGALTPEQLRYEKPPDLHINGAPQPRQSNTLQAIFGSGWYPSERAGEVHWRWAQSPAQLFLFSPSRQAATLSLVPTTLFSGDLSAPYAERANIVLMRPGDEPAEIELAIGQASSTELTVNPGWTVLTLASPAGNFQPIDFDPTSGDTRELSFALAGIELTTSKPNR